MPIVIRRAVEADVEVMTSIEKQSFSMPWSQKALADAVNSSNYVYVTAEADNMVLGYAGCTVVGEEGDITNIAVDMNYRRRGIGKELLKGLLNEVYNLGVSRVFLEVRESNAAAQSLYTQAGFEMIGLRKNFYQKPTENAVLMRWNKI